MTIRFYECKIWLENRPSVCTSAGPTVITNNASNEGTQQIDLVERGITVTAGSEKHC